MDITENELQHQTSTINKMELQYLKDITNHFSIDKILGRGGFGTVYKGEDEDGKVLAVKMLKTMHGMDDKQFLNEVKHVMDIFHPNIVRPEGYCYHIEVELMPYNESYVFVDKVYRLLCFEYLPRGSLDKYITDESLGLDWCTRYNIMKGICNGLHCLHEGRRDAPILHLDLKPANVLLDKDMVPKIADFGQSRLFGEGKTHTYTAKLMGSLGYMAPEYIEGRMSKESDIFSLGVIIMEIITGERKYPENTTAQDLFEVHEKWRRRLQEKSNKKSFEKNCGKVNQCIEVALKCMERDPKKRPNISEIIQILSTSEDGSEIEEESSKMVPPEWRGALDIVSLCSPEQSMEGIQVICEKLCRIVQSKSIMPEYIIKNTDKLVSYLTVLVQRTFNLILSGADSRSCEHTLNILKRTFRVRHLANAVTEGTLENLIRELLTWCAVYCSLEMSDVNMILDEGIKDEFFAHETNTYKLVHKIVDNVEDAYLFVVLIKILMRPLDPSRWPSCVSSVPHAEKNYHYSRLVVDILDSMSKDLWHRTGRLDLARILQSIHTYLQQVGLKEILLFKDGIKVIKENSETETRGTLQYGLRAVMKVLEELVNGEGPSIKYHLSTVPVNADPQPMIVAFIDLYLEKRTTYGADYSDDEEEESMELVSVERHEAIDIVEWHETIDVVALCSPDKSIKGVEVICYELGQMIHSESIVPEYIINDADRLVSYLTIMVERTSKLVLSGADSSSYKYILDTLERTYRIRDLARAVKEDTLENLMRELVLVNVVISTLQNDDLNVLLDEDIKKKFLFHEQYIDKLGDRFMVNVEATSMLVVLMKLLIRPLDPSRWPSCTSSMSLDDKNDAYLKLVGGRLSTVSKAVLISTRHIDIDRILQSIHTYLEQLGMEELERRWEMRTTGDPVVGCMKVLKKLVKLKGSVVKRHLSMVPLDADPQPLIVVLIDNALQDLAPQGYDEETDSSVASDEERDPLENFAPRGYDVEADASVGSDEEKGPSVSSDEEKDSSVSSDEETDLIDSHEDTSNGLLCSSPKELNRGSSSVCLDDGINKDGMGWATF